MSEPSRTTRHVNERPAFDIECPECGHDKLSIEQNRDVSHIGPINERRVVLGKPITIVGCALCPWKVEIDADVLEDIDVFKWEVTRTESTLDYDELFEIARERARDSDSDHDEESETEA